MSESAAQCCDKVYFCPTSGDTECPVHGGFDVCCDRPDLHRPVASAAQGHRDAELEQPQILSDERLWEIVRECLLKWQAYPSIPGSLRWSRNGITAAAELYKRAAS